MAPLVWSVALPLSGSILGSARLAHLLLFSIAQPLNSSRRATANRLRTTFVQVAIYRARLAATDHTTLSALVQRQPRASLASTRLPEPPVE